MLVLTEALRLFDCLMMSCTWARLCFLSFVTRIWATAAIFDDAMVEKWEILETMIRRCKLAIGENSSIAAKIKGKCTTIFCLKQQKPTYLIKVFQK
jgi:hypothetical protein